MDITIPLSAKRCAVVLGLTAAALTGASIGASLLSFVTIDDPFLREVQDSVVRLLWVDGEGSIPAWYSASLLLGCAILLAVVGAAQRQEGAGDRLHWLALSLIFALLSMDETVQIHELAIQPIRDLVGATGIFYYAWILPAGLALLLLAVVYLRFLSRLPARTRRLFLLAAGMYVGGAVAVEAVSGWHAAQHGERTPAYHAITTVEELLEMTGLVVFIYALLDHLGRRFPRVGFRIPPP